MLILSHYNRTRCYRVHLCSVLDSYVVFKWAIPEKFALTPLKRLDFHLFFFFFGGGGNTLLVLFCFLFFSFVLFDKNPYFHTDFKKKIHTGAPNPDFLVFSVWISRRNCKMTSGIPDFLYTKHRYPLWGVHSLSGIAQCLKLM